MSESGKKSCSVVIEIPTKETAPPHFSPCTHGPDWRGKAQYEGPPLEPSGRGETHHGGRGKVCSNTIPQNTMFSK